MLQTETPEQELERLIREQEADDTPIIWPDIPYAIPLDKAIGDDESLGGVVGVEYDFDGEEEPMLRVYGGRSMHEQVLNADWHGTYTGYQNHGCRCDRCRKAAVPLIAENVKQWRKRHNRSRYRNHGCRCTRCKAANARYMRMRRNGRRIRATRVCAASDCTVKFTQKSIVGQPQLYCSPACSQRECRRRKKQAA